MKKSKKEITPDFFSNQKKGVDIKGKLVVGITQAAVLLIIAILFVIFAFLFIDNLALFASSIARD